jgi:hypothetical protein
LEEAGQIRSAVDSLVVPGRVDSQAAAEMVPVVRATALVVELKVLPELVKVPAAEARVQLLVRVSERYLVVLLPEVAASECEVNI